MKVKEIEKILKQDVLSHLNGWGVSRNSLFVKPIGLILFGVSFESSGFDTKLIYADIFVRPLYLPAEKDSFKRVVRMKSLALTNFGSDTNISAYLANAIKEMTSSFFDAWNTPRKIASRLNDIPAVEDPYELEAISISYVLLGDKDAAVYALKRAIAALEKDDRSWAKALARRLAQMQGQIESDFSLFGLQLEHWRNTNLTEQRLVAAALPWKCAIGEI